MLSTPQNFDSHDRFTRLTHMTFAIFLVLLGAITGWKQYFGDPIDCWVPGRFPSTWSAYSNSVCYFSDDIYLLTGKLLTTDVREKNYYKWTPHLLLLLAVLYLIPEVVLRFCSNIFSLNLARFLDLSRQIHGAGYTKEIKEDVIQQLTFELKSRLDTKHKLSSKNRRAPSWTEAILPSFPVHIQMLRLNRKITYLIGSIVPILFLSCSLGLNFNFYEQIANNNNNNNITAFGQDFFPTSILCTFPIRQLQNMQTYYLQCHVSANDMFGKTVLLVCLLSLVVCSVGLGDIISFLIRCLVDISGPSYNVRQISFLAKLDGEQGEEAWDEFARRYLTKDGTFLLELIVQNSSRLVASQVLSNMWEEFKSGRRNVKDGNFNLDDGSTLLLNSV